MKTEEEIQREFAEPFPPSVISWRPGMVREGDDPNRGQCLAFAYVTAGAVMDRLDQVVGIGNWSDSYVTAPNPEKVTDPAVMCVLKVRIEGEWVSKADVAENTDVEGVKGGFSDSFKRAAVKWNIGRYLKRLDPQWVPCVKRGKTWVIAPEANPKLPRWAIPGGTPMQEPQPRRDVDTSTGEMQTPHEGGGDADREARDHANGHRNGNGDAQVPSRPATSPAPAPSGDLQTEWNTLCKLMQAAKPPLPSVIVGQSMGGKFDRNTFANWLQNGTNRNAVSLIEDAIRDRERAAAPAN